MQSIEFPVYEHPRVSILIVAWRQHSLLESCLRALARSIGGRISYEVIVVLNGATPEVEAVFHTSVRGVRVVHSPVNLGFAGGNNRAASVARGEYLVLLNDDAAPEDMWLDWLVATADARPRAGVVGGTVLFPDGRIQEAGSIIWNDGSTAPVARTGDGESIDWLFVRRVDYVSACSMLVRRSTWEAIGGLDERYFPAYYEDVDFCLAAQARGEDVLYEPRSRVRHHESASSSNDFKSFLFRKNQPQLFEKWRHLFAEKEPAAPWSPAAISRAVWRARGCPRRLLVIDDLVPSRSIGAGFGRMFDALIELADDGYALSLYPRVRVTRPSDALISRGVAIVGEELSQHLARADVFYDAVIVSRPHNFEPVAHFVREHQPRALLIYDAEALYWRRIELQAALAGDEEEATRLQVAARSMQDSEERMFREADYAVTVSHEEADVIRCLDGVCPISVLLPTEPDIALTTHSFRERRDVGYVAGWLGGADTPNGDGLRWFVSDVLPHLRKIVPWVRLRVTGAKPPEAIRALADPNVHFEGHVDDLARFYDEVRVVIAPIRYGAGVKLKTVHALQHGVPIVATRVGAEGVDTQGLDAIDVVDAPEAFAERVALLLTDPHAWQERRETIEQLVNSWQRPEPSKTWSGALDTAFSGVNPC